MTTEAYPRDKHDDHWLYRVFDDAGRLLYIGITTTGVKRFRVHGNRADWWSQAANITIEHHVDRDAAHAAEIAAIIAERPLHNRDFSGYRQPVPELYRRCRFCGDHFKPQAGYMVKRCCPQCRSEGKTRRSA